MIQRGETFGNAKKKRSQFIFRTIKELSGEYRLARKYLIEDCIYIYIYIFRFLTENFYTNLQ